MKKTIIIVMLLTILSQIFGFGRDLVLSYYYGTTNISDVYLVTLTITGILYGFIGNGIFIGYIPLFTQIENDYGKKSSLKFSNNLISIISVFSVLIVVLGFIYTETIVKLFASGFDNDSLMLAVKFTRITLICIFFISINSIFKGYLRIQNSYIIPAVIGFPLNFFVICSIIISFHTYVEILALGFVIGTISQFLLLYYFSIKKEFIYKPILDIKDENIKTIFVIALPVIFGSSISQINTVIDRTIASQITVGGISALNYANTINGFVLSVFVASISTVMYPIMSKMVAQKNMIELRQSISQLIVIISVLTFPATIGILVLSVPIVTVLFGRGAFDDNAIFMTSNALFFYTIGLIGFALRDLLSSVFYSLQDSKTPLINAAISMVLNIILNIILSKILGIGGLALATSLSAIFCTFLLTFSLRKKVGSFGIVNITISLGKIVFASIIMGIIVNNIYNVFLNYLNMYLTLLITIIIGALFYFIIIYILKVREVYIFINELRKKFQTR